MKRKLLLINTVLFGVLVLGASELYSRWLQAEGRYVRVETAERVVPLPEYPAPGERPVVRPVEYMPVVDRMLFTKDRNPIVEVVVEETPVVQRPDLPLLAGLADFGDGPRALMAAGEGNPEWIKVGGKVGAFTFGGIEGPNVKLSWNGEPFTVTQEQLAGNIVRREKPKKPGSRPPATPAQGGAPGPAQPLGANAANAPQNIGGEYKIGKELRPGVHSVDPGDKSPDGTTFKNSDGSTFVKTVRRTPFGSQSWWEKKQ
jgi:hypothetical protein